MLKNLCIWYLRMTNTAVFLNLTLEDDVHVSVSSKQRVYHTRPSRHDNGSLHIYYE